MASKRARPTGCFCRHAPLFLPPLAVRPSTLSLTTPLRHRPLSPLHPPRRTRPRLQPRAAAEISEPVLRAVESLARQPRVTIADVSASAGVPLAQAQDELVSLAAATRAAIDVTDAGILAYRFPRDPRAALRAASLRARLSALFAALYPPLFTLVRVSFGALLILSIIITFLALAALSSAGRGEDDDRRGPRTSFVPRMFAPNPFDLMFYSRPTYFPRSSRPRSDPGEMSFLEAVYSFVFGDGDPNVALPDARWRRVAATIRANNGAVTAEQLAPLLDPPSPRSLPTDSRALVDESYVLPALTRFNGHPEVTPSGDIIYVFPSLSTTGARTPSVELAGSSESAALLEDELALTRAPPGQRALVVALGLVNVFGVITLSAKLSSVAPLTGDAAAFVAFVRTVYPALAGYAASFVVIPLARFFRNRRINKKIRMRNAARQAAELAMLRPAPELRSKLAAARDFAQKTDVVQQEDVVYSSDLDVLDQPSVQENLTEDFDRRLNS